MRIVRGGTWRLSWKPKAKARKKYIGRWASIRARARIRIKLESKELGICVVRGENTGLSWESRRIV